jgi:hypothetical protein
MSIVTVSSTDLGVEGCHPVMTYTAKLMKNDVLCALLSDDVLCLTFIPSFEVPISVGKELRYLHKYKEQKKE